MIFYLVETGQSLVDLRRLPKRELAKTLVDRLAFFTAADAAEAAASANNRQLLVARFKASTVRVDVGYKTCTPKSLAWSGLDLRAIAPELEVHAKDRSAGFLSLSRQQWRARCVARWRRSHLASCRRRWFLSWPAIHWPTSIAPRTGNPTSSSNRCFNPGRNAHSFGVLGICEAM